MLSMHFIWNSNWIESVHSVHRIWTAQHPTWFPIEASNRSTVERKNDYLQNRMKYFFRISRLFFSIWNNPYQVDICCLTSNRQSVQNYDFLFNSLFYSILLLHYTQHIAMTKWRWKSSQLQISIIHYIAVL